METRLKEVLAVVNNKGGVGKTTTVQSLAVAITRQDRNARVLVIDLDPQGDLSKLLGWNKTNWQQFQKKNGSQPKLTITDVLTDEDAKTMPVYLYRDNIYYVPSTPALQKIEPKLVERMQPYLALRRLMLGDFLNISRATAPVDTKSLFMGIIPESFDYVLIDCPPALSMCTYNAMAVASGLLIPVQMEGLSVSGLAPIIIEMERVKRELNPQLELRGILPVMVDQRPNISRSFIAYLEQAYGDNVTTTIIPRSVKVNEAQTKKQDIYEYKQWSPVAIAYEQLVKELFN